MAEAEDLVERREDVVEERLEVDRPVDAAGDEGERADLRHRPADDGLPQHSSCAAGSRNPATGPDPLHLADVGRQEPEDPLHPRVRGDRLDPQRHLHEERRVRLRPHVAEAELPLLERDRVDDRRRRARVLLEVSARLVEELPRDGDVPVVDLPDLAQVGDVRRPVEGHVASEPGMIPWKQRASPGSFPITTRSHPRSARPRGVRASARRPRRRRTSPRGRATSSGASRRRAGGRSPPPPRRTPPRASPPPPAPRRAQAGSSRPAPSAAPSGA